MSPQLSGLPRASALLLIFLLHNRKMVLAEALLGLRDSKKCAVLAPLSPRSAMRRTLVRMVAYTRDHGRHAWAKATTTKPRCWDSLNPLGNPWKSSEVVGIPGKA